MLCQCCYLSFRNKPGCSGVFLHRERLFRWCQKEQQKIWLRGGGKECNSMLWIALHKLKYDISDFQLLYFTQALDKPAKLQWFGHDFQSVHAPNVLQEMLWVTAQTDLVGWAVVYFRFANTLTCDTLSLTCFSSSSDSKSCTCCVQRHEDLVD